MLPVLHAEESMREAERHLIGRVMKPELAADVLAGWERDYLRGERRRRKAPPIPRHLLEAIGMGYEEVPPRVG